MAQTLIQVKDLKKYYNGGDVKALDSVTVDVYKGDVIARDDVALVHVHRDAVQRLDVAAVVVFLQVLDLDKRLCHQICTSRCCFRLRP